MLQLSCLLKYMNLGVSFHPDKQYLVKADQGLARTLQEFNIELDGHTIIKDGKVHKLREKDGYVSIRHLSVEPEVFLSVYGFHHVKKAVVKRACAEDKQVLLLDRGKKLRRWGGGWSKDVEDYLH